MNQILSTSIETEKNKKQKVKKERSSNNANIGAVLKFFGIAILLFGILIIGKGVITIIQNQAPDEEINVEPTFSLDNKTDTTILLKVTHPKGIAMVQYTWNSENPVTLTKNGETYLEQEIAIPVGKSVLHVLVKDIEGNEATHDKEYERKSKINVESLQSDKINITYTGDKLISYMTYRFDEKAEQTVTINSMSINQQIQCDETASKLTIVLVDKNNNEVDKLVKTLKILKKPTVTVETDDTLEHFIIKATDETKLTKIEFKLNQDDAQSYVLNLESYDYKELTYTLPMALTTGTNMIEVTVYDSDGYTNSTQRIQYK